MLVLAGIAVLIAALEPPMAPLAGRARVSDGDSFRLGDDRVRLLGIDAPELAQECDSADGSLWSCGRVARDRMAQLLAAGAVDCWPEGHDQYGRALATCSVSGLDLGGTMVAEGLAVSSGGYWTEEAAARREGLGIWTGSFDSPRNWREDHARPQGLSAWLSGLFR